MEVKRHASFADSPHIEFGLMFVDEATPQRMRNNDGGREGKAHSGNFDSGLTLRSESLGTDEFTVVVLREKPDDIVDFAADYFARLKQSKDKAPPKAKGISFQVESTATTSDDSDDEPLPEPPAGRYAGRRKSVCAEPYHPDSDSEEEEQHIVNPKTDKQRARLNEAVKNILLFKNLDPEQLSKVLDAMFERVAEPGDHIIDQGDDGDNFYVIDSGKYDILVAKNGVDETVGCYDDKGSFGELALMYNTPRAATIIATTSGILWALDRVTFRKILLKAAAKKRKMQEELLENVPMLAHLTDHERLSLVDALETKHFQDGERIIKQGDGADWMYFIVKGKVSVRMLSASDPPEDLEITTLEDGYFGELALVTHKPRAASIYAVGDVTVAALDVMAFERLLGPCMDIMKRSIDDYEEQLRKLGLSNTDLR
eukprot:gene5982-6678_t